ncbi:DUF4175 domain-containing protein [Kozakia baliensis]|uniref:DUF4175 domain-containing protein n=1 Tax=Kozakia baliensis TaxID=153496 RepID=UPI00087AAA2B|nr:DUF4175 family protein [Kozakia baliensis]AOX19404.1 hypothetical protein A0U90_02830 [Kozakia baliensis]
MTTAPATQPSNVKNLLPLGSRLSHARRRARWVLLAENAWPALRLPVAMVSGYALAGLVRLPQSLPDSLHALLLAGVASSAIALAIRGLARLPRPTPLQIDQRIERASHLPFQPLLTLHDHPAEPGHDSVWKQHAARVAAQIGNLRTGWPHPRLKSKERIGWAALGAVLLAAGAIAGSSAPSRLYAAFVPGTDDADVPLPQIQAWIDLPDYAPGAPVFLEGRHGNASIPQGARLTATITGVSSAPYLTGTDIGRPDAHALDRKSWTLHGILNGSGDLLVRARGRTVADWHLSVQPDLAPDVAWEGKPGQEKDGWRTTLPWKVAQAHGITELQAEIRLKKGNDPRVLRVPIPLNGRPHQAHGVATPDLSADSWAGEEVEATLFATSASGLHARSQASTFKLPERVFHDPIAKALVALRHRLGLGEENRLAASDDLRALTEALPSQETGAILTLDLAASMLTDPDVPDAKEQTLGLTWAVALYLEDIRREDRETALANLDIRAAQAAVQAQLDHMRQLGRAGHTTEEQEELARRMTTLREALSRRLQSLMQRAMMEGGAMPDMGQNGSDSDDALSRLMRRLQSDAANGHGEDAMRRLQELESMTERMRNATPEDLANIAKQLQAQAEAQAQRSALRALVKNQTKLLDHVQSRLGAKQRILSENDQNADAAGGQDLANMPTSELLRRLGLKPPPGMEQAQQQEAPPPQDVTPSPLDPATQAAQDDQRRDDHATQRALHRVDRLLNDDVKTLTGKNLEGLTKADADMKKVRHALSHAQDIEAQAAEQQVLKDLAEAGQQMSQAQKGKSHGGGPIALLPTMGKGGHSQGAAKAGKGGGDQDDEGDEAQQDKKSDRDPLGRKLGKGNQDMDMDGQIPEANSRDRAREIERELRHRDSDRTRPQSELDYLDRLLKSY